MNRNETNLYDLEPHIAEIYDQSQTYTDDVDFIRSLMRGRGALRILEPFCGTGRILIPLALDGHALVGVDQAVGMLDRARAKVEQLPEDVQQGDTVVAREPRTWRPPSVRSSGPERGE